MKSIEYYEKLPLEVITDFGSPLIYAFSVAGVFQIGESYLNACISVL